MRTSHSSYTTLEPGSVGNMRVQEDRNTSLSRVFGEFFIDLNDLEALLDDGIHSLLTVTGSPQDAFADTAGCYVRWHWGQRGIDILNWLSQFLLTVRKAEQTHLLRVYGEDGDTGTTCIELQGSLDNQSSTSLSEREVVIQVRRIEGSMRDYFIQVAGVASKLAWIVAAFKDPPEDDISFSSAKIEGPLPHFQTDKDRSLIFRIKCEDAQDVGPKKKDDSTCWHKLFTACNVAVGFRIPERPRGMRGVELPFPVMATFASCNYPVKYKGGFVFEGWVNALFPVRINWGKRASIPPSAVQWHLFTTERHRLYMEEAKMMAPRLRPVRTKLSKHDFCEAIEQCKRHFLGLYEYSKFRVGNSSEAEKIAPIYPNDRLKERRLHGPLNWTRDVSFSAGGGPPGASFGVSTSARFRRKRQRQLKLNEKRNVIEATIAKSTILFDLQTRVAWMLPQVCVVIYLIQAWIKNKHPNIQVKYPDFHDMSRDALKNALSEFLNQQIGGDVELRNVFNDFASALKELELDDDLKPAKRGLRLQATRLAGVDFADFASMPETYSILTTNINVKSGGNWLQVLKCNWMDLKMRGGPYRIVTLFCDSLIPQPMMPIGHVCDTWFPPPFEQDYLIAAMHCIKELAGLHGTDPVQLSRIHHWERGRMIPFARCHGKASSCNRLQRIGKTGRRDEVITDMVRTASSHAVVVFGRAFPMDLQCQCITKESHKSALPTQPAPARQSQPSLDQQQLEQPLSQLGLQPTQEDEDTHMNQSCGSLRISIALINLWGLVFYLVLDQFK
ncbi:hypothetical protein TRVA0_071S00188 [Trichomonascus vanleenenianus]|uniref:uncharacterized protein n=1 Tax=Trichomonascus vanleenenianus TaxID=2268995 RepID=UPI003EC9C2E7